MSKRIALLSAAALQRAGPHRHHHRAGERAAGRNREKTVMVGGAAMFPSKNIVQNAVNSKDHTTLVAAVKAAGLVDNAGRQGPVHGVRADQRRLRQAAGRHRRDAGEAREQGDADQDPHLSRGARQARAADLSDGKKLKTAEGEELTVKHQDGKVWIVDAKGGTSMVTISNVNQSNGVIHVVDTVLMPAS